mmetsp:Transcript_35700/g.80209  ORF Transcript_35700/g.80209 Transcript_35700/m.80209 type:complete len:203 (-) Transcript_35700:742-1350(-)
MMADRRDSSVSCRVRMYRSRDARRASSSLWAVGAVSASTSAAGGESAAVPSAGGSTSMGSSGGEDPSSFFSSAPSPPAVAAAAGPASGPDVRVTSLPPPSSSVLAPSSLPATSTGNLLASPSEKTILPRALLSFLSSAAPDLPPSDPSLYMMRLRSIRLELTTAPADDAGPEDRPCTHRWWSSRATLSTSPSLLWLPDPVPP